MLTSLLPMQLYAPWQSLAPLDQTAAGIRSTGRRCMTGSFLSSNLMVRSWSAIMPRWICGPFPSLPIFKTMASHSAYNRGIYCMLVVATILDLVTPELVKGLRAFVARYPFSNSLG